MFAGRFNHALDPKGRTMVPKRFRARLDELGDKSVWITNALGPYNHLDVRPDSLFRAYQERVAAVPETPLLIQYKRFYFGSAIEVELDAAGRLLIPAGFRARCALTDRVSFVGLDGERFQLWNPEDLDADFESIRRDPTAMLALLGELGV